MGPCGINTAYGLLVLKLTFYLLHITVCEAWILNNSAVNQKSCKHDLNVLTVNLLYSSYVSRGLGSSLKYSLHKEPTQWMSWRYTSFVRSGHASEQNSCLHTHTHRVMKIIYLYHSIFNICSDFKFLKHHPQAYHYHRVFTVGHLKKIITEQQHDIYVPKTLDIRGDS